MCHAVVTNDHIATVRKMNLSYQRALLKMPERNVGLWFSLDANRINARQHDSEMNELEVWHKNGVIDLYMSGPAANEARKGGAPQRHRKIREFGPIMLTLADTQEERILLRKISHTIFGRLPTNENEFHDVEIVFNAKKYPGGLITEDSDILSKRNELKSGFGIRVWRTTEAIELVQRRIKLRDDRVRMVAARTGEDLPDWIGSD
jgi:hypothetical protein